MLLNLVINAEQAMLSANGRGVLVVRTWHDADHESVILESTTTVRASRSDLQPKIFDPFFTTKEVGQGNGPRPDGRVRDRAGARRAHPRWDSRLRRATFCVELPVSGGHLPPGPIIRQNPEAIDAMAGASVLVVEDEAALASAVADALRDVGYLVEHASDGEEALARVKAQAFDAVICDLKMPRLDGKAFYKTLAAGTPGLARRVIFVTGDVAGTDAEAFLEQSGCRWLAKPFRLGELLRVLREVLG